MLIGSECFFFVIYQWYSLRMSLVYGMGLRAHGIFLSCSFILFAGCIESTRGFFYEKTWQDLPGHARHSAALLLEWQAGGEHLRQSYSQGEEKNEEKYTRHVGHWWSWRLANFGWLVWLGDSLDFVSWNMKKWTISRCYRYHHCRSAWCNYHNSNLRLYPDMKVLGPARDTAEYAAWHVEPYSVPCHSGLAKCCWYIYDDLRISMHMYTSSADWVGNCSQCKVELCMWSFHIPESLLV